MAIYFINSRSLILFLILGVLLLLRCVNQLPRSIVTTCQKPQNKLVAFEPVMKKPNEKPFLSWVAFSKQCCWPLASFDKGTQVSEKFKGATLLLLKKLFSQEIWIQEWNAPWSYLFSWCEPVDWRKSFPLSLEFWISILWKPRKKLISLWLGHPVWTPWSTS